MIHLRSLTVLALGCCFVLTASAEKLGAGQEGQLVVQGNKFPCMIYVPRDWKAGSTLPLIFFLHGSGGRPTTWPWKTATGGSGYIIVGLSYGAQADGGAQGIRGDAATCQAMIAFIEQVRALVKSTYGINEGQVFLSGLSMGGWGVNFYGFNEKSKGRYRGYAILAAGPMAGRGSAVDFSVARGAPVLVCNGEKDQNLQAANQGVPLLKKAGAIVKQVVIPGEGHVPAVQKMAGPLREWLEQHGPLGPAKQVIEQARAAERAGKPGKALALYDKVARAGVSHPVVARALEHARELEAAAQKQLDAAVTLGQAAKYAAAMKALDGLIRAYDGHKIARDARVARAELRPKARAALASQEAEEQLARALKLVAAEQWVAARAALQRLVSRHAETPAGRRGKAELEQLESNPKARQAIQAAAAERECKSLLRMATNYERNRMTDKARECLDKILTRHPGTKWAEEAKTRKEALRE